jgi:phytoene synthase
LTNFIRDVREDWELDRVYLPGLDEETLRLGLVTPSFRERIGAEVSRARTLFALTAAIERDVPAAVRPGIRLARSVYVRVLDRIESLEGDVLSHRTGLGPRGLARAAVGSLRAT